MKNKYRKLHKIVIGKSGSGKSFNILSNVKDNKVNIICYPEEISYYVYVYEKVFPEIFLRYRQDVLSAMPPRITNINENTLLKCDHHYSPNIFNLIEWAKQDSEDLSRYRFIFLDSLWNQLNQADKIKYFLLLSELNTEVVIEMGGLDELLEMTIRDYNSKIINNYWTILEKECS
ncbi:hypothetical protein ERE_32620 [Agathobacter rectalis M104/1]|jgi:hypothetical protein|uniref:hypothetical protein n=1 Tax=Agathobacter rectalis TaxID=39491 RepID=UPI0001CD08FB|nr:hypothetical protein [Agathobacter rectalis]CBK95017.1 hypothetical protein ERE_32620 [Agathobacter rectalis M104/1]